MRNIGNIPGQTGQRIYPTIIWRKEGGATRNGVRAGQTATREEPLFEEPGLNLSGRFGGTVEAEELNEDSHAADREGMNHRQKPKFFSKNSVIPRKPVNYFYRDEMARC